MEFGDVKLAEDKAEILEAVWTLEERGEFSVEALARSSTIEVNEQVLSDLGKEKLISVDDSKFIKLLPAGRRLAAQIIRRHRLAERLVCDVLGSKVEESESSACEFEHVLAEDIANSICTLLGHPRYCPHDRPIPEGECCRQAREVLKPLVASCDQLAIGETARVIYLRANEHTVLRKLSALGIAPGVSLKLLQKWPSYVVQCDETEIAIEEELARNIHVWRKQ
jgi:DtxR family transcriptional regulator, Mn-dependent transcriptional regulator